MEILYNNGGNYEVKDWAWLTATFGPGIKLLDAGNVAKFKLIKLVVTAAEASINCHLTDEQGKPVSGQPCALSWPSLAAPDPSLTDLTGGGLKSLWAKRAAIQGTNQEGQAGFGIGTGFYIKDLQVGGPGTCWVLSPSTPSDGLTGIGMLGGTVHECVTHLYFQLAPESSTPPPTDPPPTPDPDAGTLRELVTSALAAMTEAQHQAQVAIDALLDVGAELDKIKALVE